MFHGKSWRKMVYENNGDDDSKHLNQASHRSVNNPNACGREPEKAVTDETKRENGESIKARFLELKEAGNMLVKKVRLNRNF